MKTAVFALFLLFAMTGLCVSAEDQSVHGTYLNKGDPKEYFTLYPDGTFVLKQRKNPPDIENPFIEMNGKYTISGESLKLILNDGGAASGKFKDLKFEDQSGTMWVKQGSEKPKPLDRPKSHPIKFY